ncbi:MotA/TolQ/ExbB proton channel family protein [Candidatus Kirkpatrickella diaphorinae]|uniref:Biopolymer transport protein ExbB n=1 Tax=Candidatus Kirkpatrickella diaphorinae TaxID=2984322 RepID=A0ABY6GH80_9PROT|nr:MotA/TolQ/ExbB proton channel family protein [Candidatus Kirkpatrickella diaphorinae]UYH50867.1 MotA/TolQ/ExbB proton channel family protein [Candidatus Kirkpatrickella diaphorinae]
MTRLFRVSALAAPALALTLAVAPAAALLPQISFAQATGDAAPSQPASQPDDSPAATSAAPANAAPEAEGGAADASAPADAAAAAPANPSDAAAPASPEIQVPQATVQDNPYGLKALWAGGDAVARSVLLILVVMSVGTWIIMVLKFIEQAKIFSSSKAAATDFWNQSSLEKGAAALSEDSPFRYVAETGVSAARHHENSMRDAVDLNSWVATSIQRSVDMINSRLQGGLAFLGTVGSTSPFVGLFGTVWGIYHALTAIGIAGQASIDKVAGPVGEALIMTAIGLATAVPAVLGYNLLVRRNKGAMDRVRNFAADVQAVLLGGYRHGVAEQGESASPTTITSSSRVD